MNRAVPFVHQEAHELLRPRKLGKSAAAFFVFSSLVACSGSAENAVIGGDPTDSGDSDASGLDGTAPSQLDVPDATRSADPDGSDGASDGGSDVASDGASDGSSDAGSVAEGAAPDTSTTCVPDDAADCANLCGTLRGRCAQVLDCGGCLTGETCGGGGPNKCGSNTCVPDCAGKSCGAADGCGNVCGAGTCGAGLRCVSGTCRCDATSCASGCCSNDECKPGTTALACGLAGGACATCSASEACNAGTCSPIVCPSGTAACASGCCKPILAVGSSFACAVERGAPSCWGSNKYGALGAGSSAAPTKWKGPVDVAIAGAEISSITAGQMHACALTTGGGVKCWGWNFVGQVGNDSRSDAFAPAHVVGLSSGVVSVASKVFHTCAALTTGAVKCWGSGGNGRLGNASTSESLVPVDVLSLNGSAASVAVGHAFSCALLTTGGVKCWGDNSVGQLGTASSASSLLPADVFGLGSGVKQIAAGERHACALTMAGGVKCWGENYEGQLGTGTTANSFVPVDVAGLSSGVASLTAGRQHTCARMTTGTVKCWGGNGFGQLGNASTNSAYAPVDVTALSDVIAVEAGGDTTCVALGTGTFQCWGDNLSGQLATGSFANSNVPVNVTQECNATTCTNGCCSAGRCKGAGSNDTCGASGGACFACPTDRACMAGTCGCALPYQPCATGCCLASTDGGASSNTLVVPSALGEVTSGEFTIVAAQKTTLLYSTGACPLATPFGGQVPTLYVEVANRSLEARRVSIWSKAPASGSSAAGADTIMAAYAGAVPPASDAQRAECMPGTRASDRCTSQIPTACVNDWAGLVADDTQSAAVTIAPSSSVTVMVQRYFDTDVDGLVGVAVRVEP